MSGKTPPALSIHGINTEDFAQWKHHPVTKALHRYLEDYRTALQRDHLDRWEAGETDEAQEAEARGRAISARELKELKFEDLLEFYSTPVDDEASERSEEENAGTTD